MTARAVHSRDDQDIAQSVHVTVARRPSCGRLRGEPSRMNWGMDIKRIRTRVDSGAAVRPLARPDGVLPARVYAVRRLGGRAQKITTLAGVAVLLYCLIVYPTNSPTAYRPHSASSQPASNHPSPLCSACSANPALHSATTRSTMASPSNPTGSRRCT